MKINAVEVKFKCSPYTKVAAVQRGFTRLSYDENYVRISFNNMIAQEEHIYDVYYIKVQI